MKKSKVLKTIVFAGAAATAAAVYYQFNDLIGRKTPKKKTSHDVAEEKTESERQKLWRESNEWLDERGSEMVSIQSHDGLQLVGEFFEGDGNTEATVLLVHGYRSNRRSEYAAIAKFLLEAGYNILMVDDRAHGESEGKYVGFGCLDREDCYRWLQYLDKRFEGKQKLFLHGVSMGASTVLMASSMNLPSTVKGIIGDCGFTVPMEEFLHVANKRVQGLKNSFLLKAFMYLVSLTSKVIAGYGFNDCSAKACVAKTKIPVFIIHGDQDDFVPTYMGKEIYEACNAPKELWLAEGAAHAESYYVQREEYERRVLEFYGKCQIEVEDED